MSRVTGRLRAISAIGLSVIVLVACSTVKGDVEPAPSMAEPTPSTTPDTVEGVSANAAIQVLDYLIARPPSDYVRGLADVGDMDFITTRRDQEGVGDALDGPHLSIDRDLDILPNGDDVEGGNEITASASVPVAGGRLARVDADFTFTQHSVLAQREFSPEILRTALRSEMGSNVAFASLFVTLNGQPVIAGTGYYLRFDEQTGGLTVIDEKTREQVPASAADERQIESALDQVLVLLKAAETARR
jgi:hypothetical protein